MTPSTTEFNSKLVMTSGVQVPAAKEILGVTSLQRTSRTWMSHSVDNTWIEQGRQGRVEEQRRTGCEMEHSLA